MQTLKREDRCEFSSKEGFGKEFVDYLNANSIGTIRKYTYSPKHDKPTFYEEKEGSKDFTWYEVTNDFEVKTVKDHLTSGFLSERLRFYFSEIEGLTYVEDHLKPYLSELRSSILKSARSVAKLAEKYPSTNSAEAE